jgi:hypothetical protein
MVGRDYNIFLDDPFVCYLYIDYVGVDLELVLFLAICLVSGIHIVRLLAL